MGGSSWLDESWTRKIDSVKKMGICVCWGVNGCVCVCVYVLCEWVRSHVSACFVWYSIAPHKHIRTHTHTHTHTLTDPAHWRWPEQIGKDPIWAQNYDCASFPNYLLLLILALLLYGYICINKYIHTTCTHKHKTLKYKHKHTSKQNTQIHTHTHTHTHTRTNTNTDDIPHSHIIAPWVPGTGIAFAGRMWHKLFQNLPVCIDIVHVRFRFVPETDQQKLFVCVRVYIICMCVWCVCVVCASGRVSQPSVLSLYLSDTPHIHKHHAMLYFISLSLSLSLCISRSQSSELHWPLLLRALRTWEEGLCCCVPMKHPNTSTHTYTHICIHTYTRICI